MNRFTDCLKCIVILVLFAGCGENGGRIVPVPRVNVSCENSSHTQCQSAANGKFARTYLTRSGCSSPLFQVVASSVVSMSCSASGCQAQFSSWLDANENPVNEIISGSISVCVLLDFNSNLNEDAGELTHSLNTDVQAQTTFTIDSWSQI